MKDFLSSKNVSLGCAVVNSVFAYNSFVAGSWGWFVACTGLALYCLRNYLKG